MEADEAILAATMELLAEEGFTGMSMEEVARRAGVGKDTLYRRHGSKVDLVRNAIGRIAEQGIQVPDTGSFEQDLRVYLRSIVRLLTKTDFGLVVAGLVGEAARNPELAEAFRAFWQRRRQIAKEVLLPAHDDDASAMRVDPEVLIDVVIGALWHRLLMSGAPLGRRFVDQLTEVVEVLAPRPGR